LAQQAENVHSAEQSARDQLILEHIPLLRHIVGRMSLPAGPDRDDVYGVGMLGLIAAADSFDPGRGLKFSTYAYSKIRGAVLDELRRSDFLPRGRRESVRELDQAIATLEQQNGVPPSPEELALHLGIGLDEVDEILASARQTTELSLDADTGTARLGALLSDPRSKDPVGSAQWSELKELLVRAITELPEQERSVITLYYAEELYLRDISSILGVSESRVSQIHTRALYRLNRALAPLVGTSAA
jgi:RNA polymerase sigma factor for flagellar operon FliA